MSGLGIDFIASHTGIWINIWVILALIALIAIIVYFILRRRKLVKMEKELEDLLEEKYEREGTGVGGVAASAAAGAVIAGAVATDDDNKESTNGSLTPSEADGMPEYK